MRDPLLALLDRVRTATLATTGPDGPEASMAPFACQAGTFLLHLSRLARHRRNLERDPRLGLLVCTPETEADSPLALPRLSVTGRARPVPAPRLAAAKAVYLEKLPEAAPLFEFPDFRLYAVEVHHARWIGGFGEAHTLTAATWRTLFS